MQRYANGVVFEASTDVDSSEHLIIPLVGLAQVFGHFVGSIKIGDFLTERLRQRGGEVMCAP